MPEHPDGPGFLARASAINDFTRSLAASAPSAPLPSLDPDESSQQNGRSADIAFRHSWWRSDRKRLDAALSIAFPDSKRLGRFRSCGDAAWVYRSARDPAKYKVCCDSCRDRWCRSCQRDRSRVIAGNLRSHLPSEGVKLVTLTLRHRNTTLRDQVDRLFDGFRTLRRKPLWRDRIRGGVSFLEVTYNSKDDSWHPHLHVIATGDYLPQRQLAELWRRITGDSFIVDIRPVTDVAKITSYVVKYATKPIDVGLYRHPRRLLEAIRALQGRRMATTFGEFRGWRLTAPGDDGQWDLVASLETLRHRASIGDPDAQGVLDCIRSCDRPEATGGLPP